MKKARETRRAEVMAGRWRDMIFLDSPKLKWDFRR